MSNTKFIKAAVKASEKYNQYQKSEVGNDVYEQGAFLEGFYDAEKQFIEVPDRESELIEMLEKCKKSLDWVFEYCTPPTFYNEEQAKEQTEHLGFRRQELFKLIQSVKSER